MTNLTWRRTLALLAAASLTMLSLTTCASAKQDTIPTVAEASTETLHAPADADTDSQTAALSYESKLFDSSYVHTIDITVAETDWSDLLENPTAKTKYQAGITIDGETLEGVSFSTKGNTSLSSVAEDPDSDRYSFKVNFGKYSEGQTYYGLNKLNLNNLYADATYMKDYLSYEIFREAGVDAPLTSYVWLTVNGEAQGLYIAIEDIGESYLERTQDGEGELYKPETAQLDNDNMGKADGMQRPDFGEDFKNRRGRNAETPADGETNGEAPQMPQDSGNMTPPDGEAPQAPGGGFPQGNADGTASQMPQDFENMTPPDGEAPQLPEGFDGELPQDMQGFPGKGMDFGSSNTGASLAYTDDALTSYSDIFDNAVTDADDTDKERVVAALQALSEGTDLASCLDTDEVIRYFAAHNYVLNYDSYTGNMLHNYFLYEKDGRLSMLPWDYNLAFGAFSHEHGGNSSDATALVNTGIDTPLSGAEASARPMWAWIAANDEYLAQYHEVYDTLLTSYFESGRCEAQIDALYEMLLPYVEQQTNGFYSAEEFKTGVSALKQFCRLRAESIRAQLDGSLSADSSAQDAAAQIDASGITVSDMGSQGFGGKEFDGKDFGGMNGRGFGGHPAPGETPSETETDTQ